MALTREQQEQRRNGIGSSEIAAIAGLDPFRGPMDVFLAKTMPIPEEAADVHVGRQPIKWGNRLEWLILEEWAAMRGYSGFDRPGTLSFGPIALATPDAVAPDQSRGCEAKAVGHRSMDAWSDGATPDHYALQCQWMMGVTRIRSWDLCGLLAGQDWQLREVHADDEMFATLLQLAEDFWRDHVQAGIPPPLDHRPASRRWLRERFPREIEPLKPASAEALGLLALIRENRAELERCKEQDETMRNQLRAMIGEAQGIEGVAKWSFRKAYSFTTEVQAGRVLRLAKE